jgi:hypothetical protein
MRYMGRASRAKRGGRTTPAKSAVAKSEAAAHAATHANLGLGPVPSDELLFGLDDLLVADQGRRESAPEERSFLVTLAMTVDDEMKELDERLSATGYLADGVRHVEGVLVRKALSMGYTWEDIATQLGTTRQTLYNRYGSKKAALAKGSKKR